MRTIVDIPSEQIQQLAELCRREHLSRAEAVRRAIELLLKMQPAKPSEVFGLWRGRDPDGVRCQQLVRSEWPYTIELSGKTITADTATAVTLNNHNLHQRSMRFPND